MKKTIKYNAILIGIAIIVAFVILGATGGLDDPNWNETQLMMLKTQAYSVVPATQANSALSFGTGVYSKHIIIINDDGTNEIFIDLDDTTATTDDIEIKAGEKLELSFITTGIGIICSSGETASVRVMYFY